MHSNALHPHLRQSMSRLHLRHDRGRAAVSGANVQRLMLVSIGDHSRVAAEKILKKAKAEKLDEVMVIGRTNDGELWAESSLNAGQSLWLIEKLRERILSGNPWSIV